jgi:hypothetical protein
VLSALRPSKFLLAKVVRDSYRLPLTGRSSGGAGSAGAVE